jgi:hypothetical protein
MSTTGKQHDAKVHPSGATWSESFASMRIITTGIAPTEGLGLEFRIAQLCLRRSPGFGPLPQSAGVNDSAESSASTTLPPEATQFLYPTGSFPTARSSVSRSRA